MNDQSSLSERLSLNQIQPQLQFGQKGAIIWSLLAILLFAVRLKFRWRIQQLCSQVVDYCNRIHSMPATMKIEAQKNRVKTLLS